VRFFVNGTPATQGSKRAFVVHGRPVLTESGGDKWRLWRHAVNDEARRAWGSQSPLSGPVSLTIHVKLPKPASTPKRRRTYPTGARSGDVDKYCRAILDSLTGVIYGDDSQVVSLRVEKDWAEDRIGAEIEVAVVAEEAPHA